ASTATKATTASTSTRRRLTPIAAVYATAGTSQMKNLGYRSCGATSQIAKTSATVTTAARLAQGRTTSQKPPTASGIASAMQAIGLSPSRDFDSVYGNAN